MRYKRHIALVLVAVSSASLGSLLEGCKERSNQKAVTFMGKDGALSSPFYCEVARTEAERSKGLMYRKELAKDEGMIFVMPSESIHSFWMRNTFVPLDMVFVDSSCKVVDILHNVPVLNDEPRTTHQVSKFVVELPAGAAEKEAITLGTKASFCESLQ